MWVLLARAPVPDAACWPGRRWLAALDAALWPMLLVLVLMRAVPDAGVAAPVGCGLIGLGAWRRLRIAVWNNERYGFTTAKVARVLAVLLIVGAALKLGLH